jgi:endonuclease/exonuclease/phosphatase (EEP) superfamily protein YafD
MKLAWCALLLLLCGGDGCAAGGKGDWPLHAELFPAQRRVATQPARVITVGTYNLHQQQNAAGLQKDLDRIDADVWLFEEVRVTGRGGVDELRALLPSPDSWNIALVRVNPRKGAVEAQAIATKMAIDRAEIWPLPSARRRRCALAIRAHVGGHDILLVDTDHEPRYFTFSIAHDPQLHALADRLGNSPESAVIVGGDFNTCGNFWHMRSSRSDAAFAQSILSEKGYRPAIETPAVTFSAGLVRGYLDQIFVRGLVVVDAHVVTDARGSDHLPLVARLSFNQP